MFATKYETVEVCCGRCCYAGPVCCVCRSEGKSVYYPRPLPLNTRDNATSLVARSLTPVLNSTSDLFHTSSNTSSQQQFKMGRWFDTKAVFTPVQHATQIALCVFGARYSYEAITKLRGYEEATKKAAKFSQSAEDHLNKTRKTQAVGAIAVSQHIGPICATVSCRLTFN